MKGGSNYDPLEGATRRVIQSVSHMDGLPRLPVPYQPCSDTTCKGTSVGRRVGAYRCVLCVRFVCGSVSGSAQYELKITFKAWRFFMLPVGKTLNINQYKYKLRGNTAYLCSWRVGEMEVSCGQVCPLTCRLTEALKVGPYFRDA